MPLIAETQNQGVQVETCTDEKGVNTEKDWELMMRSVEEHSASLSLEYEALVSQQAAEEADHCCHIDSLEKQIEEKKRQHQMLIEKVESVRVKLELNSSKTTRKNFTAKRQELTAEKEQKEEEKRRLAQELEASDRKLRMLVEEQKQERLTWSQEIADLQTEMERLQKQAAEANKDASIDEIAALEMQREVSVSQMEDWIAEAESYISTLRLESSAQLLQHRLEWEKNVAKVRSSLGVLQSQYNENLQLLQRGQPLDSLPQVPLPVLPHVPTLELLMSPIMFPLQDQFSQHNTVNAPFMPSKPHPAAMTIPPTAPSLQHPPIPTLHQGMPAPRMTTKTPHLPKPSVTPMLTRAPVPNPLSAMPVTNASISNPLSLTRGTHTGPAGTFIHTPTSQTAQLKAPTPPAMAHVRTPSGHSSNPAPQAPGRPPHSAIQTGLGPNPAAQPLPGNPAPAGILDKLLEKLGTRFPQCTRTQLTGILQQIKTARGTMAGMSVEDLTQKVAQRLAQSDRPSLGPIGPPSGARGFPSASAPALRPPVQLQQSFRSPPRSPMVQVFPTHPIQPVGSSNRKLCLMCQNQVDAGSQYHTGCSHILHKNCISVWHQSSKNNSCPFCPTK